jgi:hypothetical protein
MEWTSSKEGFKGNPQVEKTSFTDVCRDEFGGELDGVEEHRQVACGSGSETVLFRQNVSISRALANSRVVDVIGSQQ